MNYRKNDPFTNQMRSHLKTTAIRLGLVRLLMNAGRAEEASTTLASLPSLQCVEEESDMPTEAVVSNEIPVLV